MLSARRLQTMVDALLALFNRIVLGSLAAYRQQKDQAAAKKGQAANNQCNAKVVRIHFMNTKNFDLSPISAVRIQG